MNGTWKDYGAFQSSIMEEVRKALDTSTGAGALFDNVRDRLIAEELDKRHPLWRGLRKVTGQGAAYLFSRKTARAGGADWTTESGQVSTADAAYASISETFKVLDAVGTFTKLGQAAGKGFIELQRQAVADTLDDWVNKAESGIIIGTGTGNEPTGLDVHHDAFSTNQLAPGTNGTVLTLARLDEAIDLVTNNSGIPNRIVTSARVRRETNALLQANQRFMNVIEIEAGFRTRAYDDIPIFDSNAIVDEVQGSASDAQRLNVIDDQAFFIAMLMPPRPFELAVTKATVQDIEVLGFLTYVQKNRLRISQIPGIIPPP